MNNITTKLALALFILFGLENAAWSINFWDFEQDYNTETQIIPITEKSPSRELQIKDVDKKRTIFSQDSSLLFLNLNYKNKPRGALSSDCLSLFISSSNKDISFKIYHTYRSTASIFHYGAGEDFDPEYFFDENLKYKLESNLLVDNPYKLLNTNFQQRADRPGAGWFRRNWGSLSKKHERIDTYSTKFVQGVNYEQRCGVYEDFSRAMGFPTDVNKAVWLEMKCPDFDSRS